MSWALGRLSPQVIKLDTENRQVGLSIKQLQPDPIMETLDTVLPLDGSDAGCGCCAVCWVCAGPPRALGGRR